MNRSLIVPIPVERQAFRTWTVKVNNSILKDVFLLEIEDPKFGQVTYGLSKAGHDGWSFRDVGGAVTIPFSIIEKQLFVGVVKQLRHNQGGYVWNVPRGFVDFGETLNSTASRELFEESGYKAGKDRIVNLEGEPGNCNSSFFETPDDSNAVRFFAVEINPNELIESDFGFRIRPENIENGEADKNSRAAEMIDETRLIPWHEAAHLSDMFSNSAVARLLAYLVENDALSIS